MVEKKIALSTNRNDRIRIFRFGSRPFQNYPINTRSRKIVNETTTAVRPIDLFR